MAKAGIDRDRIDPQFLVDLAEPLEDVYERIEHDLMVNIARQFKGVKLGRDAQYPVRMLARLGRLTDENYRIIARYSGMSGQLVEQALRQACEQALNSVDPELARSVTRPDYIPTRDEAVTRTMEEYRRQAINTLNMVNTVMLNSSLDAYRQIVTDTAAYEQQLAQAQVILNEEAGAVTLGSKSPRDAVRDGVIRMADNGLYGFTDRAGHRWSAQAYVTMDIRTTAANAARQASMDRNADYGNNLIEVSSHIGARPLCAPYQGKVFSTDGTSGTAHDATGRPIPYTPLSGTSYGQPAGLFGINCGHFPYPFVDGVSMMAFKPYPKALNDEVYKQSQEQRYQERQIRHKLTDADALEAAGDKEGAEEFRRQARVMTQDLRDWCDDNGRTFRAYRVTVYPTRETASHV
ncbi:MAG: hypothetical protein J6S60_03980 [Oscillospiraceae bacterium]|nr:hypothetical protein [Oscillospiraceae bacterium]